MSKQIVDKSSIIIPEGTIEDFQRPNHPDFMTTTELHKAKFSGFRHNRITNEAEIWMLGNIEARVTAEEVKLNPLAVNKAMERVFALEEVMPDTQEARAYIKERDNGKS